MEDYWLYLIFGPATLVELPFLLWLAFLTELLRLVWVLLGIGLVLLLVLGLVLKLALLFCLILFFGLGCILLIGVGGRAFYQKNIQSEKQFARKEPPFGLPNSHLNCYLNSTLQCLFITSNFPPETNHIEGQIATLIKDLKMRQKTATNLALLGKAVMPEFGSMQCAHVAFLNIVNALSQENNSDMHASYTENFGVDVEYQLKCTNEHIISTTVNNYFSLSLPIPANFQQHIRIDDCFDLLAKPKMLDFPCKECRSQRATHTAHIARVSPILVLHFQRYFEGGKDDRTITFPATITVPGSKDKYEVYGVVHHYGTLSGGHYYAYVKYGPTWYEANDAMVAPIGGMPPCEGAYLLFCKWIKT